MKMYKKIILGILLLLGALALLVVLPIFDEYTRLAFVVLIGISFWFCWQYANGEWPNIPFLIACIIAGSLSALTQYITFIISVIQLNYGLDDVLTLTWGRAPSLFISAAITTPIHLLLWCWLFKEPRLARQKATTDVTTDS